MTRAGFTLVETIVALVILAVGILGISASAGRLTRLAGAAQAEALAQQAAQDRLSLVLLHPAYGGLDTLFTATEESIPGLTDFRRATRVTRVQDTLPTGRIVDYTLISVEVDGPLLDEPVASTAVVGAP